MAGTIKVTSKGLELQTKRYERLHKQIIPAATVDALNWTAYDLRDQLKEEIKQVFDRPTRFTIDSVEVLKATLNRAFATVRLKDYSSKAAPAAVWLAPQVYGGERREKRSEKLLKDKGILPAGMYIAPGSGMKLDSMGNVGRGQMQKILSGLGTQADVYQRSTNSKRSIGNRKRFFVMTKGKTPLGIAERFGKQREQVRIVLAFIRKPSYSQRFDFYGIAERYLDEQLPINFDKALARRLSVGGRVAA